ncbi:MAG: all3515 family Zur-repressed PEP-CTERM protein [Verrucomicrobiota bacterium]|nr:all3515 family Zur-repressed PEP-CTERM protein [Verrucomicrobiota bacterium]
MKHNCIPVLLSAMLFALAIQTKAELLEFYVGIDGRQTLISGSYINKPNPNANRLTFLYAHVYKYVPGLQPAGESAFDTSHYHGISSYSYTGPVEAPIILNTNANSRIPETFTGQAPLTLVPGTNSLYAGKLVSAKTAEHYSNRRFASVWKLRDTSKFGPGSPEYVLFNSSGGTRTNSLAGATISLELVEKSDGLHIGTTNQLDILSVPGDRFVLGEGNEFDFAPIFWVDGNAPVGRYSVALKLVDTNTSGDRTPIMESGIFWIDFQVAPEPSLAIERKVEVSMPLVTQGYVLESAPSADGPWNPVSLPRGEATANEQAFSFSTSSNMLFFRLKK